MTDNYQDPCEYLCNEDNTTAFNITCCYRCGKESTKEGHDGCIGKLPGVMNACCGHGGDNKPYVQFWDNTIIDGKSAIIIIKELMKYDQ